MLSVAIQKDVASYEPKLVAGLSARTLLCCAIAIAAGLFTAWFLYWVWGAPEDAVAYVVVVVTLPFWAAGFWRPKGMKLEEFAPLWLKHKLTDDRIFYVSSCRALADPIPSPALSKDYVKVCKKTKGVEAYGRADSLEFNA